MKIILDVEIHIEYNGYDVLTYFLNNEGGVENETDNVCYL